MGLKKLDISNAFDGVNVAFYFYPLKYRRAFDVIASPVGSRLY